MVSFPKNHANTKKLNAKLSSNKKILKKVLKLHPKITKSTESVHIFRNYNVRLLEKRKMYCHYTHMRGLFSF